MNHANANEAAHTAAYGARNRRGQGLIAVAAVLAVVVLLIVGYLVIRGRGGDSGAGPGSPDLVAVKRGSFDITIPTTGELVALQQIEVRNRLDTQSVIAEIVPEGKFVQAGDVLLRLNDEELRTKVNDGVDEVNVAEAAAVAAQADLEIKMKERESELAKADLAIRLAELALKAWQEGEDTSKRRELALAVETAQKNYDRLVARFEDSGKLLEQEFISLDEYKQDEIAMIEARAGLEQAKLDVDLYEKYTFFQDKATKESDLEQAQSERERVEKQYEAELRTAQSELDSKKYQLESKKERLRLLQQQLSYCVVKAPSSGLVVYAASLETNGWGRNEGQPPQVGTQVYPNELIIVLPDTSRMVASVKINEALSGQIQPGQRAVVTSDAMPGQSLFGTVESVGVLAQTGGWRDPNRRDYTVRIVLDGDNSMGLKPSMRCKADINIGRVTDAAYVPVQAVLRTGPLAYVHVPVAGGVEEREVKTGRASELFIEVTSGLNEGDLVLVREPTAVEVVRTVKRPEMDMPAFAQGEAAGEGGGGQRVAEGSSREGTGNAGGVGAGARGPAAGGGDRESGRGGRGDGSRGGRGEGGPRRTASAGGDNETTQQPGGDGSADEQDGETETSAAAEDAIERTDDQPPVQPSSAPAEVE